MKGGEKHDACQNNHSRGTKSVSAKLLHLEAYARSRGHIKQIHDRNFNLLSSVTVEPFTSFLEPTLNLFTANRRRSQVNSNMTSRADAQRVPAGFLPGQWATPDTSEGGGGDGEGWACVHQLVSAREIASMRGKCTSRCTLSGSLYVTLLHRLATFPFLATFFTEPGPHTDDCVDASLQWKLTRSAATLTFQV